MTNTIDKLLEDIKRVNQIPIVPTMLEIICSTTGLGFAAIARVTSDRWIACSVRDEINFGLQQGGELQIKTTLCNEIRASGEAIIIDHVSEDEMYRDHHTPKMYGFESYISMPIKLQDGSFFGTLCAIDPRPSTVSDKKIVGLFTMFAELLSFHLQSMDVMEESNRTIKELSKQVIETQDENQQYQFISNHNLAEPLRKLRLYSNRFIELTEKKEFDKAKALATKIDSSAQRFSMMLKDITAYTNLSQNHYHFDEVDLNKVLVDVSAQLDDQIRGRSVALYSDNLPSIWAMRLPMEQLFFQLLFNAIKFSRPDIQPNIRVTSKKISGSSLKEIFDAQETKNYVQVDIKDNGIGIDQSMTERIFEMFTKADFEPGNESFGIGLTYCRKITKLHNGYITVSSTPGQGSTFSIMLPLDNRQP